MNRVGTTQWTLSASRLIIYDEASAGAPERDCHESTQ